MRLQFIEEQKLAKKMMAEDSNSQAAQEARKEREREAKALEENEKELIKMAEIREKRKAKLLMKQEKKIIHGIDVREKVSSELMDRRRQRVLEMIEGSKNFVTMDNLEEKIEEVLGNKTDYNFALSISGKKIS